MTLPSPAIGDRIAHHGREFVLQSFPTKVGLPPGAAYEATFEMTPKHEAAWERDSLGQLVRAHVAEHKKPPTADELVALQQRAKLRPTPVVWPRDGGASYRRPRVMRLTGLVADLVSHPSGTGWLVNRRDGEGSPPGGVERRALPDTEEG